MSEGFIVKAEVTFEVEMWVSADDIDHANNVFCDNVGASVKLYNVDNTMYETYDDSVINLEVLNIYAVED